MQITFRDVDEIRLAERRLRTLKQRGSASKYTLEFQQVLAQLVWADPPLMDQYYFRLKKDVKNKILRADRPTTLQGIVELAVRVDN